MRVKLAHTVTGLRNGKPWPPRGEVVDLPEQEAVDYLKAGIAVPVEDEIETSAIKSARGAREVKK